MGAAASMQQIYREAMLWYKKYFDEEMYQTDFESIDKDSDGAITYHELHLWIQKKATNEKGAWTLLLNREEVVQIAHDRCAKLQESGFGSRVPTRKVVDVVEFKRVLIHLFAISTLWVHFKNADEWVNSMDFGNFCLSLQEFRLACATITGSYAHEQLTEEQILEDFNRLDTNKNGSVDFMEVCDYCCTFIDPAGYKTIIASKSEPPHFPIAARLSPSVDILGDIPSVEEVGEESEDVESPIRRNFAKDLHAINSLQSAHKFYSLDEKNMIAMEAIAVNMDKNQRMADFMEIKFNTENEVMAALGQLAPV